MGLRFPQDAEFLLIVSAVLLADSAIEFYIGLAGCSSHLDIYYSNQLRH